MSKLRNVRLQHRYIRLLRDCLTDSIYDGTEKRVKGLDRPARAYTAIGTARLDNLQACLESVVADGIAGHVLEAGVWRGGAVIFCAGVLAALGANERKIYVCDTFSGAPTPDAETYPLDENDKHHTYKWLAVLEHEVRSHFEQFGLLDHRIQFVPGLVAETLPGLDVPLSILRLDMDTYGATWEGLHYMYPRLRRGGYVIIDDWGLANRRCRRAVMAYRREHKITDEIWDIDGSGVFWRKT